MLLHIVVAFLAIAGGIGLRYSPLSPVAHLFRFSPPSEPGFTGPCTLFPSGYDHSHPTPDRSFSYFPDAPIPADLIEQSDASFLSNVLGTPEISPRKVADKIGHHVPGLPHRYFLYNENGHRIFSATDCKRRHGYVYLLRRADLWTWPAIAAGETLPVDAEDSGRNLKLFTMTTLSTRPRVFHVPDFLEDAELAQLREQAKLGTFTEQYNKTVVRLDYRLSLLLRLPLSLFAGEQLQFQTFAKGEGSAPTYNHATEDPDGSLLLKFNRNYFVTVIFYLEQSETGGETNFPLSDADSPFVKVGGCKTGLKVKPKPGSIIFYYNIDSADNIAGIKDPWASRAECAVGSGSKTIAIRTFFNRAPAPATVLEMEPANVPYGYRYNYLILPNEQ